MAKSDKEEEIISIREYSRRKGCSDTAVRKAIKSGKIVHGVVKVNGFPKINPVIADAEWKFNYDPSYADRPSKNEKLQNDLMSGGGSNDFGNVDESQIVNSSRKKSLTDLKRDAAEVKLASEVLKLKQIKGQLVDKDKVHKALFDIGQIIRTRLQSIPDRVIDEILSAQSRNESHSILFNAISDALEDLSRMSNDVKI